jgi:preprotein translocase subunit SecG
MAPFSRSWLLSCLVLDPLEADLENYLYVGLIITSIALIASVILQSKGAGLGGLTGGDTGGIFTARRGIEKTLFRVTIVLGVVFFVLATATVMVLRAQLG